MKTRIGISLGWIVAIGNPLPAVASSATWTGLGADSAWTTAGNWSASPVPGAGDVATFNSAGNGKTTITTAPAALHSYVFGAGSSAYSISASSTTWSVPNGGGVTLQSGVTTDQNLSGIQFIRPASGSTTEFVNQAANTTLKLGTIFNSNASSGNAVLKFSPSGGATIEVISGKVVDNASTAGRTVSILLNSAGTVKMAATGTFSGTDADGNSVTIRQGTLMANSIGNSGSGRSSLGNDGRIQFGEAGQTRTATLDYYNTSNATTNRVFDIIDNNTAVFKVSGGSSTSLAITSGITQTGSSSSGGKLIKDGAGILALNGSNAFSGQTSIAAGRLVAGHANALGTAGTFGSRTTIQTGGTLELATDTSVANEFLDVTGGNSGAVVVNRATAGAGITQSTGTTYLGSGSTMTVSAGSNVTSGTATLGISNVILAGGSSGSSTLNSGTAAISVTGGVSVGVAFSKTLILDGTHSDSGISGALSDGSGTLSLTKAGSGTWTLGGSSSFTGDTAIESGKLVIQGNISTSDITVNSAATLGGSGTVGNVNVEAGGIFSPGSSTGTMSFVGNLMLGLDSISDFEIDSLSFGGFDLASAQAGGFQTVDFGGGILNLLFQPGFNSTGTVKIFDFDAYSGTGFGEVNVSGLASGYSAIFDSSNGVVTVIPEPGVALFLGAWGSIMLLGRRRG